MLIIVYKIRIFLSVFRYNLKLHITKPKTQENTSLNYYYVYMIEVQMIYKFVFVNQK